MTTTTLPSSTTVRSPERDLRRVLAADAVVTGASGLLALVEAAWVGDLLGVDATGRIRAVGAFDGAGVVITAVAGLAILEVGITKLRFRDRL